MNEELSDKIAVKNFILSGEVRFTLVSRITDASHTYKVKARKDRVIYFVSHIEGSDGSSYGYLGVIFPDFGFHYSPNASRIESNASCVKALQWFMESMVRPERKVFDQLKFIPVR